MKESVILYFINGIQCGPWVWTEYKKFFTELGYECVFNTLLYHDQVNGHIDHRLGTTSVADYANAIAEEIQSRNKAVIIIGHSMGGLLAPLVAQRLQGSGLVRKMVLINPALPAGIVAIDVELIMKGFYSIIFNPNYFWYNPVKQSPEEAAWCFCNKMPSSEHQRLYNKLCHESGRALLELGFWMLWPTLYKAIAVDKKKIRKIPTLIIIGAQDRITKASKSKLLARVYRAEFKEFPDNAHWIISEPDWESAAKYIHNWLLTK